MFHPQNYMDKVFLPAKIFLQGKLLNFVFILSQMKTTLRNRVSCMIMYLNTLRMKLHTLLYWGLAWYTTIPVILMQNGKSLKKTVTTYVSLRCRIYQKELKSYMTMATITGQAVKKNLVIKLSYSFLHIGKPFTYIGNWFWHKHKQILDWNK